MASKNFQGVPIIHPEIVEHVEGFLQRSYIQQSCVQFLRN